jgi:glutamine amidotransferase
MAGIRASGADVGVRDRVAAGRPVLGICVGLQVLYEEGDEHGEVTTGIGVRRGRVARLDAPVLPHMGWNTVEGAATSALFDGVVGERFYFVHSYGVTTPAAGDVTSTHGASRFVAAVDDGALAATQFHPEKSGDAGLRLLENWVRRLG